MAEDIEKLRNVFGTIVAFLGASAFFVAAATTAFDTVDFLRTSVIVPGRVTGLSHGVNHPEITFVTKAGERVSYTQNGFGFDMEFGDDVRVHYLPEDPRSSARLDRVGAVWDGPIGWGILGIGFSLGGVGCLLKLRRARSRKGN